MKNNGRYRFRTINTGGPSQCPIELKARGHFLTVIAADGHPVEPVQVDAAQVEPGLVLNAHAYDNNGYEIAIY